MLRVHRGLLLFAAAAALLAPNPLRADEDEGRLRASADLAPPGGPLPPSPKGTIDELVLPATAGRPASSRLKIDLDRLHAGAQYTLWADDPSTADPALVQFAAVTADDDGHAKVKDDTHDGDSLPFGATLTTLAGKTLEVHDAASVVVLTGSFPTPVGPGDAEPPRKGKSVLTRPAGSTLPDSVGNIDAEARAADGVHAASSHLRIRLEDLAAKTTYTVWGDDPATADTTLVQFASVKTNRHGDASVDDDTRRGDTLPFGATLDALAGKAVEVRDGANAVVISGNFPALFQQPVGDEALHGRSSLAPPGGPTPPSPSGKIEERVRPADGEHAASSILEIEVRHLKPDTAYTFWSDDPATADTTLTQFASATTSDDGHAKLVFDAGHGDALPFGATLDALAGKTLEVRDGANVVVLTGTFPTPAPEPRRAPVLHGKSDLTRLPGSAFPDSVGRVEEQERQASARGPAFSVLRIRVKHLAPMTSYTLWTDDPSTADPALVQFATLTTDVRGGARIRYDTRRGDTLPFGATLDALAGKTLELRDGANAVVLTGVLPTPR